MPCQSVSPNSVVAHWEIEWSDFHPIGWVAEGAEHLESVPPEVGKEAVEEADLESSCFGSAGESHETAEWAGCSSLACDLTAIWRTLCVFGGGSSRFIIVVVDKSILSYLKGHQKKNVLPEEDRDRDRDRDLFISGQGSDPL